MWEIWTNSLLLKALKSCPKSKNSPDLVTLPTTYLSSLKSCSKFLELKKAKHLSISIRDCEGTCDAWSGNCQVDILKSSTRHHLGRIYVSRQLDFRGELDELAGEGWEEGFSPIASEVRPTCGLAVANDVSDVTGQFCPQVLGRFPVGPVAKHSGLYQQFSSMIHSAYCKKME